MEVDAILPGREPLVFHARCYDRWVGAPATDSSSDAATPVLIANCGKAQTHR